MTQDGYKLDEVKYEAQVQKYKKMMERL